MGQFIINKIIKSAALLGVMLACQSSFAGVGIYMSVTNDTGNKINLRSCVAPNCDRYDHELAGWLPANYTAENNIYREATYSYNDAEYSISIPLYYNTYIGNGWVSTLACYIDFTGTTYVYPGGTSPRIKNVEAKPRDIPNEHGYTCETASTIGSDSNSLGDTVYISATVSKLPAFAPLNPGFAPLNPPLYPPEVPGCNILPPLDDTGTLVPPGNYCPLTVTISNFTENNDICMEGLTANYSYVTFYQKDTTKQNKHGVTSSYRGTESYDNLKKDYGFSTEDTIKMWKCH